MRSPVRILLLTDAFYVLDPERVVQNLTSISMISKDGSN
jgi:hypothetical protein